MRGCRVLAVLPRGSHPPPTQVPKWGADLLGQIIQGSQRDARCLLLTGYESRLEDPRGMDSCGPLVVDLIPAAQTRREMFPHCGNISPQPSQTSGLRDSVSVAQKDPSCSVSDPRRWAVAFP